MFTNPEDQSILSRLLKQEELSDWLPALSVAMQQSEKELLQKAKSKSAREATFINNLRKLQALQGFLKEFKLLAQSQEKELLSFWREHEDKGLVLAPELQEACRQLVHEQQVPSLVISQSQAQQVVIDLHPLWAGYLVHERKTLELYFPVDLAQKLWQAQTPYLEVIAYQASQEYWQKIQRLLSTLIQDLIPWRKGPFKLLRQEIDAEWDCGKKWERIETTGLELQLAGKNILDVGCGNGYYLWQMLMSEAQPNLVLGVEPFEGFTAQFLLAKTIYQALGGEEVPYLLTLPLSKVPVTAKFDLVFNMGVLYHRKDPVIFLEDLGKFLTAKGTLVLETIVIDGDEQ
ncbi:DUF1698 domain-containing protein, partial [Psittacicella gerlachiana]